MFTGLIADRGSVRAIERDADGARLRIDTALAPELGEGDSIAVNGVCLTATSVGDGGFAAEVIGETLRRSSLGELRERSPVNLELALRASDRLGGHVVQGHVDGVGTIAAVRQDGFARVLDVAIEPALARYLVGQGSIALDGVSLTVSALSERGFSVSLIPETLQRTGLGEVGVGSTVNVEVDVLAKHVERLLQSQMREPATEGAAT
ncbi:MAG TPA: riboflavin synthase [Solirubrobacteraceae bacterium]|jgi:riboflavin synthase|nr:riboflavin synthase [Solirubrobacteraceae bacterium]